MTLLGLRSGTSLENKNHQKIMQMVRKKSREEASEALGELYYDLSYFKRQNQIGLLTQEKQRSEISKLREEIQKLKFQLEQHRLDNTRLHARIYGLEAEKADAVRTSI